MEGILLGTGIGVLLGLVSGIIPGIHANTLAGVMLSFQAALLSFLGPVAVAGAMFAALMTHTFVDAIPATFLGVPDADTSLAVLPAHALCIEGNGEEAVRIAALGSACAIVISVPLSVVCLLVLPAFQPFFDWWIGILIIASVGYMIVTNESPCWALVIFGATGLLGAFTLRYSFLSWQTLPGSTAVLMPLLAGLFGISILVTASDGVIPDQIFRGIRIGRTAIMKSALLGTLAGIAVGWLPGLSTASANGILASLFGQGDDRRAYILATNAANTANAFIGLAALLALSRMRNGVMVALSEIPLPSISEMTLVGVLASAAAYAITITLSGFAEILNGINFRRINWLVVLFIILLCIVLTGPFGAAVLLMATLLGLVPGLVNIPRMFCMGAIMVPVILFSLGIPWT